MDSVKDKPNDRRSTLRTLLNIAALVARAYNNPRSRANDNESESDNQATLNTYREAHDITRRWLQDVEHELRRHDDAAGSSSSMDSRGLRQGDCGTTPGLLAKLQSLASAAWRASRDRRWSGHGSLSMPVLHELRHSIRARLTDAEREIGRLEELLAGQPQLRSQERAPPLVGRPGEKGAMSSYGSMSLTATPEIHEDPELQDAIHQSLLDAHQTRDRANTRSPNGTPEHVALGESAAYRPPRTGSNPTIDRRTAASTAASERTAQSEPCPMPSQRAFALPTRQVPPWEGEGPLRFPVGREDRSVRSAAMQRPHSTTSAHDFAHHAGPPAAVSFDRGEARQPSLRAVSTAPSSRHTGACRAGPEPVRAPSEAGMAPASVDTNEAPPGMRPMSPLEHDLAQAMRQSVAGSDRVGAGTSLGTGSGICSSTSQVFGQTGAASGRSTARSSQSVAAHNRPQVPMSHPTSRRPSYVPPTVPEHQAPEPRPQRIPQQGSVASGATPFNERTFAWIPLPPSPDYYDDVRSQNSRATRAPTIFSSVSTLTPDDASDIARRESRQEARNMASRETFGSRAQPPHGSRAQADSRSNSGSTVQQSQRAGTEGGRSEASEQHTSRAATERSSTVRAAQRDDGGSRREPERTSAAHPSRSRQSGNTQAPERAPPVADSTGDSHRGSGDTNFSMDARSHAPSGRSSTRPATARSTTSAFPGPAPAHAPSAAGSKSTRGTAQHAESGSTAHPTSQQAKSTRSQASRSTAKPMPAQAPTGSHTGTQAQRERREDVADDGETISLVDIGYRKPERRKKCHHDEDDRPEYCDSVADTDES